MIQRGLSRPEFSLLPQGIPWPGLVRRYTAHNEREKENRRDELFRVSA